MENNNHNNYKSSFTPPGEVPVFNKTPAGQNDDGKIHPEDKLVITSVHTFAEDIKNAMATDNVSMVKIALAEAKKKEAEAEDAEEANPESGKNKTIIMLSFAMLVIGGLGFVGVWYFNQQKQNAQTAIPAAHRETIVPYDEEFLVDIKNNERREVLEGINLAETAKFEADTSLVFIPITNQSASTSSVLPTSAFLSLLNTRTPDKLVRALDPNFMLGLSRSNGLKPFILLKAESFNQVYAGMLEWEPAIADDIGDIFFGKEKLIVAPTTAELGSTSTDVVVERKPKYVLADSLVFKDEVINNKDVRALRNTSGDLLMYYAFISDKLVLIAEDFSTIDEVTRRLATRQFKQ